ncbi:MAG: hypothetical protein E4H20_03980 [Spirochaetales bacterium]|nr:MAG: hypothetical protein E4H20_03980 [Spirochaetales bacterium]
MRQSLPGGELFPSLPFPWSGGAIQNGSALPRILVSAFIFLGLASLFGCAGSAPHLGVVPYGSGFPGVTRLYGAEPGPVLLVIAGLHGDETSGPAAARLLAAGPAPVRGTIVILPEAAPEAMNAGLRWASGWSDLNRAFPVAGDDTSVRANLSDPAFARADAILGLLATERPYLVLDLHESDRYWTEGDGPSLVVPASMRASELALALLEAPCMEGFSFTGPPPAGSLAAAADALLDVPVFIVEVPDTFEPAERVRLYMKTIAAALRLLGMSDNPETTGAETRSLFPESSDTGGA